MIRERVVALDADEKICRDQPCSLVQELKERMLPVGAGLAPYHGGGRPLDGAALAIDPLAVALHLELLEIGRQPRQVLFVGQDRVRFGTEEAGVPDAEQSKDDG